MSTTSILDKNGKETGKINLPDILTKGNVKTGVLHQAVVKYQASLRQGTLSTKERGEVSGGGVKPFRQKGTGRARAGSSRSPLWKGGGITFGPHPRDFGYKISKKAKRGALAEALKSKFQSDELYLINELNEPLQKTKDFAKILKALKIDTKTLALLDGSDVSILRVSRNIPFIKLMRSQDVNALDICNCRKLLLTKTAYENLVKRIQSEGDEIKKSPKSKKAKSKSEE